MTTWQQMHFYAQVFTKKHILMLVQNSDSECQMSFSEGNSWAPWKQVLASQYRFWTPSPSSWILIQQRKRDLLWRAWEHFQTSSRNTHQMTSRAWEKKDNGTILKYTKSEKSMPEIFKVETLAPDFKHIGAAWISASYCWPASGKPVVSGARS